ncbi:BRO-N domain-containing protein [Providencia rettgeri]
MNIVANNDLTFQNFTFSPVTDNGKIWFTSAEIAKALKYKKTDSVSQIYARNADEFTDSMTTTLKMKVVRKTGDVEMVNRLFSLRGAHLIAMFASTPVAKEFRKWVLDILDKEVEEKQNLPTTRQKSVSTDGLLARLNLICDTWDLAKDDIAVFDPKMANRLGATMNMFWMYTASMKKIASKKQVRRLTH